MISPFEVATEFRFEIGEALINSKALQGAVQGISDSADQAMNHLNYLATGLVSHLGLGSGGLLSLLTRAVELTQEFDKGALGFVNSINSNWKVLTGTIGNFNDQLDTSKMLMGKVGEMADKYGLSGQELAAITTTVAQPINAAGKGGTNYENSIRFAKNIMIGAEGMGLPASLLMGSVMHALTPGGTLMGKAFDRLVNSDAFRNSGVRTHQQFASLMPDRKIDLLTKAFAQLGENAGFLAARAQDLSVQFRIMKAQVEQVLKPIGDAISGPIRQVFGSVTEYLQKNGAQLGQNVANIISGFFKNPEKMLMNLMQLKHLGSDSKTAAHLAVLVTTVIWVAQQLEKIGIVFTGGILRAAFTAFKDGFVWIFRALGGFRMLWSVIRAIGAGFAEVVPWFIMFLIPLQAMSRGLAMAKVRDAKAMADNAVPVTAQMNRLKDLFAEIISPIQASIEGLAELISRLMSFSWWIENASGLMSVLADVLTFVAKAVIGLMGVLSGLEMMISGFFMDINSFKNPFSEMGENFMLGFNSYMKDHLAKIGIGEKSIQVGKTNVTNNNKIDARFDMREQMEPDRLAFTIVGHLKKLAMDATQPKGGSLHAGLVNGR